MAGNQWVFDLETNIFSNVVTIAKPKLQKKYKSMNFDTAFTDVPSKSAPRSSPGIS